MISLAEQCQGEERDPYAEAKAAFADGELEHFDAVVRVWRPWILTSSPAFAKSPSQYRRRPKETPWYPPVPEGFGPWVEGRPPVGAMVHVLFDRERERKCRDKGLVYLMPEEAKCPGWASKESVVAHCIKLPYSDTLETPPRVLQQHAEMLAADEPVQHSNRPGVDRRAQLESTEEGRQLLASARKLIGDALAADEQAKEPVQKSDQRGIYDARIRQQIADALKPPTLPPSKPKAPQGFDVLAPMNGRVGGKWGV